MSHPTGDPPPVAIRVATAVVSADDRASAGERAIPAEVPVELVFGEVPFAVMMATPADLEDFARGFCLTEGIVRDGAEVRSVRTEAVPRGMRIHVGLAPERLHDHLARRRVLSGRTGCGLCGIDDLGSLPAAVRPTGAAHAVAPAAIRAALAGLERAQPLGRETRAVHAAAWAEPDGGLRHVREDVGRHNALDKLIGALLREEADPDSGFAVITSRCSFEMVEKAAAFGARALVAISAPTGLAIERACALDMLLVGVARADSFTVFHGAERLREPPALDRRTA